MKTWLPQSILRDAMRRVESDQNLPDSMAMAAITSISNAIRHLNGFVSSNHSGITQRFDEGLV